MAVPNTTALNLDVSFFTFSSIIVYKPRKYICLKKILVFILDQKKSSINKNEAL
jgi:hypothetical protein